MNKTKKALLDDCREHLIFAIGSAAGAGKHETAARINAILVDIDIAQEMCYTGKNAREARKTEGKKMKKYIVREFRTANDGSEYETERYEITADELEETRECLEELIGAAIDRYEIDEQ